MLKAKYKTGSTLLLKNERDVDYVYFYETEEERNEEYKKYEHTKGTDIHYDFVGNRQMKMWFYLYGFMKLEEGEDLHLEQYNMFDETTKVEYVGVLKELANRINPKHKWWYHILTAYYLYQNGKYELTKEQIKHIQQAHDKPIEDTERQKCLDWLNNQ